MDVKKQIFYGRDASLLSQVCVYYIYKTVNNFGMYEEEHFGLRKVKLKKS